MAKTATAESPADRVKRELAEREQREKEAAEAAAAQQTADNLTDEERAALDKADAEESVEKAATRELLLQSNAGKDVADELAAAKARIAELEAQKAPEEDPELAAERRRRFERAEQFEKEMAAKRGKVAGSTLGALNPSPVDAADPSTTMQVTVDKAAFDVIHRLALSLPLSTPPEHVLCGYGGIKITVGVVRALAGVRMR